MPNKVPRPQASRDQDVYPASLQCQGIVIGSATAGREYPARNLDKHLLGDTGQRNGARESAVCSVDAGGRRARYNLRHHFVGAATAAARARCWGCI